MRPLTKKQKLMAVVAVALVCLVALVYGRPLLGSLPTPSALGKREDQLETLQSRLKRLSQQKRKRDQELARLRAECQAVLWEANDRVLSTVVQNELQNIARRERATLRSVGSPKSREINENIRAVEVSVRVQGDMKEVGRFLARVDSSSPRFFWTNCTIRPISLREPDKLDLSGRIEALFAVGPAEELLFAEDG
jgi:hypothetical protein